MKSAYAYGGGAGKQKIQLFLPKRLWPGGFLYCRLLHAFKDEIPGNLKNYCSIFTAFNVQL